MTRFLLTDDHPLVIAGLVHLIRDHFSVVCIDIATELPQTLSKLEKHVYDLLVLDINIPGGDKISMIDSVRLRQPDLKILMCSSYDEELYAIPYIKAGANGYIKKTSSSDELLQAIKAVLSGEFYASRGIFQNAFGQFITGPRVSSLPKKSLSNREMDVARMLAKGMSTTAISEHLNLSLSSISIYKARVFEKLGVKNSVELNTYFTLNDHNL